MIGPLCGSPAGRGQAQSHDAPPRRNFQEGNPGRSAAARLDELGEGWLNPPGLADAELAKRTLTNLYNARPAWLANAHATLDAAVLDAYGWPADLPDTEILERLLALNLERERV